MKMVEYCNIMMIIGKYDEGNNDTSFQREVKRRA